MSPAATTFDGPFPSSPRPDGGPNRVREIPWLEWGREAFATARDLDRPVLLSLTALWSEESQQMDEGAYSAQSAIDLATSRFVPVRVDIDERPDVDARYGVSTVPATAFLTPEGDPITTHGALDATDFVAEAEAVLAAWSQRRDEVILQVETDRATRAAERATSWAVRAPGVLTPAILDVALEMLDARWSDDPPSLDAVPGVSDPEAHRLQSDAIRLWRYAYHRRSLAPAFNRAFDLAREDAAGPLFDHMDGGFFRRPVRSDAPMPSKSTRDQGEALIALAELAASDEEAREELSPAIEQTAALLIETLSRQSGAIYFGDVAMDGEAGESHVDQRVLTAPAAVAARGLLVAGTLLDRSDWVERGRRAVDFLMTDLRAGEAGMYHARDDAGPRTFGVLDDQAQTLLALLECYEVTGYAWYFDQARRIARVVERDWHEPGIGFLDMTLGHDEIGLLAEPAFPMQPNVDTAEAFLWLGRLTHDERFLQLAHETLATFAHGFEARGLAVAGYARVVDRMLSAEPEFKIVSEFPSGETDTVADPLHRAALRLPLAGRTVQRLDRVADADLMRQLGLPDVGRVAYVGMGSSYSAPLTEPDQLLPAVEELVEQPSW